MRSTPTRLGTLYLIHVLTHATRSILDQQLSELGLTAFHYTVLTVIAHNEELSSANLAGRFHVSAQAIGQIVIMLEERGLIKRKEHEANRRILRLTATPAGLALARAGDEIARQLEREIFRGASSKDLQSVRDLAFRAVKEIGQLSRPPQKAEGKTPRSPRKLRRVASER